MVSISDWLKTKKKPPRTNRLERKERKIRKYVFLVKCIENVVLREKYCQQNRKKWARETKRQAMLK